MPSSMLGAESPQSSISTRPSAVLIDVNAAGRSGRRWRGIVHRQPLNDFLDANKPSMQPSSLWLFPQITKDEDLAYRRNAIGLFGSHSR